MIGRCGLIVPDSEDDLIKKVEIAYLEYRRDFLLRASRKRWMFYHRFLCKPHYLSKNGDDERLIKIPGEQLRPDIAFLGVWDTVGAYGLPIDELERGIDQWIWPMTVADRELSQTVKRALHALSLDDERPSFRPVLWNEKNANVDIKQVWFAGVHANVGGGYPDDGLAYVSLDWMMDEIGSDLRFFPKDRDEIRDRANAAGEYYDSRSGIAGYYRYGPRSLDRLCRDLDHGVEIATPKFHPSALDRIRQRQVSYAPVSPTLKFEVIEAPGYKQEPFTKAYEWKWMEQARNTIWWRRLAYLATVVISAVLVAFPLLDKWVLPRLWATPSPLAPVQGLLSPDISAGLADILPTLGKPWMTSFSHHPATVLALVLILAWLFFRQSERLQDRIATRAELAWADLKQIINVPEPVKTWDDCVADYFRTSKAWTAAYRIVARDLLPLLFAWTVGLIVFAFVMIKLGLDAIKLSGLLKDRAAVARPAGGMGALATIGSSQSMNMKIDAQAASH